MSVKVVKFGGSSLSDANQFKKVKDIIFGDPARRYVVPSAPGKRFSDDDKVTDLLYKAYTLLPKDPDEYRATMDCIIKRFNDIADALSLSVNLEDEFVTIEHMFKGRAGRDYAASRGEYLNGKLLAAYIGFPFIDAAEVVYFKDDGSFDSERTNDALNNVLRNYEHAVIPGFYGSMPNDSIKTFSRGGSDITGSIVSRAVGADIYENWTDVSGFLVADPRIISSPSPIDTITYRELRELSYMGATVLHEDAIFPVRRAGIPINIRNTNEPTAKGTMIVSNTDEAPSKIVTGIAGKKGFSFISIEKAMMNQELGFGKRVLEVLEKYDISFEHLPSGIDTLSVIVPTASLPHDCEKFKAELMEKVKYDHIEIEDGIALVAIVGRGMKMSKGTAARVFAAISAENINIRMIDQGSSELNIIIGVDEDDFENALRAIHKEFFE